jgi:PleD family two-component response regulator
LFGEGTGASFDSVLADADAAMYAAKQAGRDGVQLA